MKFDAPATTNPIDQLKIVGQPTDRIDGPLKTTGRAPYAYERYDAAPNAAYGYVVGAAISKGRILSIDSSAAKALPGVLAVVTAENAGKVGKGASNAAPLLASPEVAHYHQAVALVVADSFEQARAAAALVKVAYDRADGSFDLASAKDSAAIPKSGKPESAVGDFEAAFAAAPVRLDETYATPDHSHAMMEPHASTAVWNGDRLTVWTSNQLINRGRTDLATTLGVPKENVRLVSPFIGGKLFLRADAVLAALGARAIGRPVKVALTRPLVFNNMTHRPATIQRIRIGARRDGKITAIGHESWSGNLEGGRPENAIAQTRLLYAGANRMTALKLAALDLPEGNAMRAPGEAPGLMALEIAVDEMAEKLGIDPLEFRIRNDTQVDPERPQRPFSKRQLVECARLGAERFGWDKRNPTPGATREGRQLYRPWTRVRFPQRPAGEVRLASPARQPRGRHRRDGHDRHRHGLVHDHRPDGGGDDGSAAAPGGGSARRLQLSRFIGIGRPVRRQQFDVWRRRFGDRADRRPPHAGGLRLG